VTRVNSRLAIDDSTINVVLIVVIITMFQVSTGSNCFGLSGVESLHRICWFCFVWFADCEDRSQGVML